MLPRSDGPRALRCGGARIQTAAAKSKIMRFYINILITYFPDLDPPYNTYYEQILEQVQLAEALG
jgi:hypothetical protein